MKILAHTLLLLLIVGCSSKPVQTKPDPTPEAAIEPVVETSDATETSTPAAKPAQDFIITTGVHGNEPSGARLQPLLEELGYNVFGPCNPWGLENDNRHLQDGQDLNRVFGSTDVPEAEAVKAFLKDNPPAFLLDLHEEPDGEACYLIVNGPDDEIGRKIVDALKDDWDFAAEVNQWGVKGTDGVVQPSYQRAAISGVCEDLFAGILRLENLRLHGHSRRMPRFMADGKEEKVPSGGDQHGRKVHRGRLMVAAADIC